MGYIPLPPPPEDPPGYVSLYGNPLSSNDLRQLHWEQINKMRKNLDRPLAYFQGADMLPGKPNIPRPIPPSDGPGYTVVGGDDNYEPDGQRAKKSFHISANNDFSVYYPSWALWKVVMALGTAFTVGGLIYMGLLAVQYMMAR